MLTLWMVLQWYPDVSRCYSPTPMCGFSCFWLSFVSFPSSSLCVSVCRHCHVQFQTLPGLFVSTVCFPWKHFMVSFKTLHSFIVDILSFPYEHALFCLKHQMVSFASIALFLLMTFHRFLAFIALFPSSIHTWLPCRLSLGSLRTLQSCLSDII